MSTTVTSRKQLPRVNELEITREAECVKLSLHEQTPGEESTIRHYEEIPVSMEMIQAKCHETVGTLNKANRQGRLSPEVLGKLTEIGQTLHDELISVSVKEALRETAVDYLTIKIDDQLVQVPWELLNDGQQFLCQRFNMGRLVKTRQPIPGVTPRMLTRPLRMLLLADPVGDLKGAYTEGTRIRDYADGKMDLVNASLCASSISPGFVKQKIRNFDFVHFAGHADYNLQHAGRSGWRLTGGSFKAEDIMKMAGTGTMPALIFSNACQSARTEEWKLRVSFEDEVFGLANSFLLAGVKHYVGTFWEILDEPSSHFALTFYKYLFAGRSIGEAIRESRQALIRQYGEETIVWASYVLYGDPTFSYIEHVEATEAIEEPPLTHISTRHGEAEARTREEVIDFAERERVRTDRTWWFVAAGIFLVVAMMLWGYPGLLREKTAAYERAALAHYNEGNFQKALDVCRILEDKSPEIALAYLIRG
ncbi:MAG: CHAT domain-containing protein, partial [Deltaproteobacteria bacterium]